MDTESARAPGAEFEFRAKNGSELFMHVTSGTEGHLPLVFPSIIPLHYPFSVYERVCVGIGASAKAI